MTEPQVPPQPERRVGTTFTDDELDRIDAWGFARRIRSRAEAIRRLVAVGLASEEMATTGVEFGDTAPADAGDHNTHKEHCDASAT